MAKLEIINQEGNRRVIVTLSRRNLLSGLHKLDMEDSARTLTNNDCWEDGAQCPLDTTLVICFEDDDEHYSKRESGPGIMHPETEEYVVSKGGKPGDTLYLKLNDLKHPYGEEND